VTSLTPAWLIWLARLSLMARLANSKYRALQIVWDIGMTRLPPPHHRQPTTADAFGNR
jgi:hypothetical protein